MRDVVESRRWWWRDRIVWWRWVGIGLLALLLLEKGIDGVLLLYEPCALPIDVLQPSFNTLSDCLSSHDGFLLWPEPLYFLLDPDQFLLLYYSFDFLDFLILVLHLNLIELDDNMNDLNWRRCPWQCLVCCASIGLGATGSSSILAGACCGGGCVGWLQLDLWDGVEGWMLCTVDDGGESLSG
jgi:hypothetical protein